MFPLKEKRITAEVCVHHLHFTSDDYARLGNKIKCNPAIKAPHNREGLWKALLDDRLDVIAPIMRRIRWKKRMNLMKKHMRFTIGSAFCTIDASLLQARKDQFGKNC
jgi:hypothetical protein